MKINQVYYFQLWQVLILRHIIQIDKNIVKIHHYADIEEIWKDIIYELLEGYKSIS